MRVLLRISTALLGLVALVYGQNKDIIESAEASGSIPTLIATLNAANLDGTLHGDGPFTVFAPSENAFASLPPNVLEYLLKPANKQILTNVLLYHVVTGSVLSADLVDGTEVTTLEGSTVGISIEDGIVKINDSTVTTADISTSNGVIHVIDRVLLPDNVSLSPQDIIGTAVESGSFPTLVAALTAADLVGALQGDGPFTVFAPSENAFASLPPNVLEYLLKPANKQILTNVLLYHVVTGSVLSTDLVDGTEVTTLEGSNVVISIVNGGAVNINDSTVTTADISTSNGVILGIDRVLFPDTFFRLPQDIFVTLEASGKYKLLVAAINVAGLADVFTGPGRLTLFAPTDDAIQALPEGVLDGLLADPEFLVTILSCHALNLELPSAALIGLDGEKLDTLGGKKISVSMMDGRVRINDSQVTEADIFATVRV
jgi:uncharacterized surface protein with fasciclin (FAS1) repeats